MREVTRTIETRDELWDAPLFYSTIVLCLTLEWLLRKKNSRMVWWRSLCSTVAAMPPVTASVDSNPGPAAIRSLATLEVSHCLLR